MFSTLRNKLLRFIRGEKETPLLAGLAAGLYPILFYYNNNYGMAGSFRHLLFFTGFFIVLPTLLLLALRKLFTIGKLKRFRKYVLPAFSVFTFLFLLMLCLYAGISKKMLLGIVLLTGVFTVIFWNHYKKVIVFQLLLAVVGALQLLPDIYRHLTYDSDWAQLAPEEEQLTFIRKPNVYVIQPDGYVSFSELKKGYYNYDNSAFEAWLEGKGFTLYPDFRSNYYSTLSSNSSLFAMKHHYYKNELSGREDITGKNNGLSLFKKNGYTTFLLLEKEYLLAGRPQRYYDFCNISNDEIPFIGTALKLRKDVIKDLKTAMQAPRTTPGFFFIEQLLPGHVSVYEKNSQGVKAERQAYLKHLETANTWLKEIVGEIQSADPNALIVILADHGGFAGMRFTLESAVKTQDRDKIYSIFGGALAVKWPRDYDHSLDEELVSSVNFFRVLFSYLSGTRTLLQHKEPDISYIPLNKNTPSGVYMYIAADGSIQCEKID